MALGNPEALSTCCKILQHNLLAINAPNQYNELRNYGLINALESARNMSGVDPGLKSAIEATWGTNKINDVGSDCKLKLWVEKPTCGEATEGITSLCNNSNTNGPAENRIQLDVSIAQAYSKEGRIRPVDYQCLCNGGQAETLQREINEKAKAILKSVELALVSQVAATMGDYINGNASLTAPKTLNLFTNAGGNFQLQPAGWIPLLIEYAQMQINNGVIAVGGNKAFAYGASANLTSGIAGEYKLPQGIDVWYDPNIETIVDQVLVNPLLTWAPGALWIMRYLDNVNNAANHINSPDVDRIVLDIYGHLFDFSVERFAGCDELKWVLNYQFDLFNLPASAWGDCLDTNQKQAYNIGCDAVACAQLA